MATRDDYRLQLGTINFAPTAYQGYATKAPEYNNAILAHNIERLDNTISEAKQQESIINQALQPYADKLNEKENQWFANYKQDRIDKINEEIKKGNFRNAITLGHNLGTEVGSDKQLLAKIGYEQDRRKFEDQIMADKTLSPEAQNYLINRYANYDYKDNIADGKIIGGNRFKATPYYESIDWDKEWVQTANLFVSEESGAYQGPGKSDNQAEQLTVGSEYHRKTQDRIVEAAKVRFSDPKFKAQILQEANSMIYSLEQADANVERIRQQYGEDSEEYRKADADRNFIKQSLTLDNGTVVSNVEEYYMLQLSKQYAKNLAYNNTSSSKTITFSPYGAAQALADNINGTGIDGKPDMTVNYTTDGTVTAPGDINGLTLQTMSGQDPFAVNVTRRQQSR